MTKPITFHSFIEAIKDRISWGLLILLGICMVIVFSPVILESYIQDAIKRRKHEQKHNTSDQGGFS